MRRGEAGWGGPRLRARNTCTHPGFSKSKLASFRAIGVDAPSSSTPKRSLSATADPFLLALHIVPSTPFSSARCCSPLRRTTSPSRTAHGPSLTNSRRRPSGVTASGSHSARIAHRASLVCARPVGYSRLLSGSSTSDAWNWSHGKCSAKAVV